MISYDNREIVRQYIEQVINANNLDELSDFIAENAIDHNFSPDEPQGIVGYRQHLSDIHKTYANFHITIEAQYMDNDTVITRMTAQGIHRHEWLGLEPTQKEISITEINIGRLDNGKIVEHWGKANTIGVVFQMGGNIVPVDSQEDMRMISPMQELLRTKLTPPLNRGWIVPVLVEDFW